MIKQVIVIRKDLKMRRGKEIAQGSHASMAFLIKGLDEIEYGAVKTGVWHKVLLSLNVMRWFETGTAKICVQVESEEELLKINNDALTVGLVSHIVTDAGRTEFNGVPTTTCCAIGPDEEEKINKITGHLKLY